MPVKVLLAVLAHRDGKAIGHLIENVQRNCDDADVVVFNSGAHDAWLAGLDAEVLRQSRPLRRGYLTPFHYLTMQGVIDREFDCLVAHDWDMLLLKRGFDEQLAGLLDKFGYIEQRGSTRSIRGPRASRYPIRLELVGPALVGSVEPRQPYNVFNPGQVFRRDLVERFVADEAMPDILCLVETARVDYMEEIVYPTRAVAYVIAATSHNPGSHEIRTYDFDADEPELLAADPHVFLVHRIAHEYQCAAVDRLLKRTPDPGGAAERCALKPPLLGLGRRKQAELSFQRFRGDLASISRGP